jgi:hypothetical protein
MYVFLLVRFRGQDDDDVFYLFYVCARVLCCCVYVCVSGLARIVEGPR